MTRYVEPLYGRNNTVDRRLLLQGGAAKSFAIHGFVLVLVNDHMPTIEVYLGWDLYRSFAELRKTNMGAQILCDCFGTNIQTLEALETILPRSWIERLRFTPDTDAWSIPDRTPYKTPKELRAGIAGTDKQTRSHFARILEHELS
ncbi:hypothetical protein LTR56_027665, partial [Elasticomyces elasticus]